MQQPARTPVFNLDPFGIFQSCWSVQKAWYQHPIQFSEKLIEFSLNVSALHQQFCLFGLHDTPDPIQVVDYDQRFQHPMWEDHPYFDVIKKSYLLITRWLEDTIYDTPDISESDMQKTAFWTRQVLNALAPTNFFWSNPKAIMRFVESNGRSLIEARKNVLGDIARGTISMVPEDAFEVGRTLAYTPGSVVYRNELLELLQYSATTESVHEVPILLVSPWINKYYIFDLNENKSLVKYLVDQGFTVFVTSWKNPDSSMRNTSMEDYMIRGVLQAVDVIREICHTSQVHVAGYCIGGTIVSALMAWLNHPDQTDPMPIAHWSLLASMADFEDPGMIRVFIDENSIEAIENIMSNHGYLDGQMMSMAFRLLRSNSLIWQYYVDQYLCGETLSNSDVLFWNMDTTRMPEAMHRNYLREFYLKNKLAQKNALTMAGRTLDMGRIDQPLYAVGAEQDHIVPWHSSFRISDHVKSPVRYTLATSGHILGIINPPTHPPKRRYWVSEITANSSADDWLKTTEKVPGSWWEDWANWLHQHCGSNKPAVTPGKVTFPVLGSAPGQYVLEK